jgi:hypothetical protein
MPALVQYLLILWRKCIKSALLLEPTRVVVVVGIKGLGTCGVSSVGAGAVIVEMVAVVGLGLELDKVINDCQKKISLAQVMIPTSSRLAQDILFW